MGFNPKRQYTYKDCKYIRLLKFDFGLPCLNLCFEYHGKQHYESIEHFGGEEKFKLRQMRDQIKIDYCKKNGIKLIIIPYWDKEKIPEILNTEITKSVWQYYIKKFMN